MLTLFVEFFMCASFIAYKRAKRKMKEQLLKCTLEGDTDM